MAYLNKILSNISDETRQKLLTNQEFNFMSAEYRKKGKTKSYKSNKQYNNNYETQEVTLDDIINAKMKN